jgi:hypothetical protein
MNERFLLFAEIITAVSTGVTSSLEAATETWDTDSANACPDTFPDGCGLSGEFGYSAILIGESENLLDPELICTLDSLLSIDTESDGSLEMISDSSFACTKAFPCFSTFAEIVALADTS